MLDFLNKEFDPIFRRRAQYILTRLQGKEEMHILDLGCGRGFYSKAASLLYPKASITAFDRNKAYLNQAQETVGNENVTFIEGDATSLPFADNQFDRVICSELLEHVPNDTVVMAEIKRVLKPGGSVLISVPHTNYPIAWDPLNYLLKITLNTHVPSHIWWLAGIWADHVRLYSEQEMIEKLEGQGLHVTDVTRSTHWALPFAHFILYGIGKNLVDRGIVKGSFSRFDFSSKQSRLNKVLQTPFIMFDRLNPPSVSKDKRFANLLVEARNE